MAKRCEVCSLVLLDDYAFQGHLLGKKHLKNVQQVQFKKRITERSIFVSQLPECVTLKSVINFFLQFGQIESYRLGRSFVIIEFNDRKPVDFLLSRPIWMNKYKLNIKPRMIHDNNSKKESDKAKSENTENMDELCYDRIKTIFDEETTFDSQLIAFLNAIQLSDVEIETEYGSICTSLDQIFKTVFPNCKTHRFGSTLTGLGFKKCDLDVYMDIGEPISENEAAPLHTWTPNRIFRYTKNLMYKKDSIFTKIVPIPKAKTPIIKFCHAPTNISCDISFKNGLGVYNSYLIKYYLSLDVRLRPMMMIIKYWARHFEISGMGKLSNYALVMLIIFYLQQPTVNIVPPIIDLQQSCEPVIVEDWQVNFNENTTFLPTNNDSTIPELLRGFFEFYASFEFGTKVICPLDGMAYSKVAFIEVDKLPDCMIRYKEYMKRKEAAASLNTHKHMCLQDPIELSHNIISSLSQRAVESFQKHCAVAADVCSSTMKNDYKNLLSTLFTTIPKIKQEANVKFIIPVGRSFKVGLPDDFDLRNDIDDKEQFIRENWYFMIYSLLKDIFEKILKLQVKVFSTDSREVKQQKVEVLSDVHSKDNDKIVFHCTGTHCMWRERKNKKPVIDPTFSYLDKEILVSDAILAGLDPVTSTSKILIDFTCLFEKKQNPVRVLLTFTDKNCSKKLFREFTSYLSARLPVIIDKTLMHMLQYKKRYQ